MWLLETELRFWGLVQIGAKCLRWLSHFAGLFFSFHLILPPEVTVVFEIYFLSPYMRLFLHWVTTLSVSSFWRANQSHLISRVGILMTGSLCLCGFIFSLNKLKTFPRWLTCHWGTDPWKEKIQLEFLKVAKLWAKFDSILLRGWLETWASKARLPLSVELTSERW